MDVEIINPLTFVGWDELILAQPKGTFFHSSHWARVISNTYGYKPLYFTVRDGSDLLATVPLMEIDSFLTGKRGVSLPFTDFCEPILSDIVRADRIWDTIRVYGEKAGWKYVDIRGGDGVNESASPSSWCYEHVLNLSPDVQYVRDNFSDSHKRNIRKAQKVGVEVTLCGSLESVEDFYRLNLITRKRHGLPSQPFSFFRNIHQHIIKKKHGLLLVAQHQGKVIAGALCIQFGNKAMYKYAASDRRYQHLRPNNLILWKAIEYYCRQGYDSFNLGKTEQKHKGLKQFKSGWGATEKTVDYYRYSFIKKNYSQIANMTDGWHTSLLKIMPIPIIKILGSVLYKQIG